MGIYVNPGNEGFRSAVNSEIYVDKTDLLKYCNKVIGTEQRWYDGYSFALSLRIHITMNQYGLKEKVIRLLAGDRCGGEVENFDNDMTTFRSADDVLTILIHLGYLGYDSDRKEAYVPNEEVRDALKRLLLVGINYDKNSADKKHSCVIEEWMK